MRLAASDRRKQLIEVASRLFSEQGFDGTSTREIADHAGINESLIFRHFDSKEDLFWAVIAEKLEGLGRRRQFEKLLASSEQYRDVLTAIAELILRRTDEDKSLTRLLLYCVLRTGEVSPQFYEKYVARGVHQLTDYIRRGIDAGYFRSDLDAVLTARAFLGMLIYHNLAQEVMGGEKYETFPVRRTARHFVDLLLNGIAESREDGDLVESGRVGSSIV